MNGYPDLAREHMEKGLFLLEQYNLLYTHDGIPQIHQLCHVSGRTASPGKRNLRPAKIIKRHHQGI